MIEDLDPIAGLAVLGRQAFLSDLSLNPPARRTRMPAVHMQNPGNELGLKQDAHCGSALMRIYFNTHSLIS